MNTTHNSLKGIRDKDVQLSSIEKSSYFFDAYQSMCTAKSYLFDALKIVDNSLIMDPNHYEHARMSIAFDNLLMEMRSVLQDLESLRVEFLKKEVEG